MKTDEFAVNDVAYVLGALPIKERLAFETHLLTCDPCTTRVSQARALAGLLDYADRTAFNDDADHDMNNDLDENIEQDVADPAIPDTILPKLLHSLRRNRGRRWIITGGIIGLAASIVAVAILTVVRPGHNGDPFRPPAQAVSMAAVSNAPISVRMQIETKDTWAQVNLWATYPTTGFDAGDYKAVARTKNGHTVTIGTWPGVPGNTTIIRTPTGLHTNEISTIEILSPAGQPLAWTTF